MTKVVVLNPEKKQDKQFAWATEQQKVEASNPNIATLPKVSLQVRRG